MKNVIVGLVLLVVLFPVTAVAQEAPQEPTPEPPTEAAPPAAGTPAAPAPGDEVVEEFTEDSSGLETDLDEADFNAIEDLLREDEAVRASGDDGQAYEPGSRRDPFRSLVVRQEDGEKDADRPEGKAGLLIDEVEIEGVFELPDGPVAQVKPAGKSETSYLLYPGDQLWDGDVVEIKLDEVVFKQSVKDPTALKPFRMVTKRLSP